MTVFTEGLNQIMGLSCLYLYTKLKPKTWLRPFMNTAPGIGLFRYYYGCSILQYSLLFIIMPLFKHEVGDGIVRQWITHFASHTLGSGFESPADMEWES